MIVASKKHEDNHNKRTQIFLLPKPNKVIAEITKVTGATKVDVVLLLGPLLFYFSQAL